MKSTITHALAGFVAGLAVLASIALLSGCSAHKQAQIRVPKVPYKALFDPAHCRYLPDGIRFKCHDVVFDPQAIDASGK